MEKMAAVTSELYNGMSSELGCSVAPTKSVELQKGIKMEALSGICEI
jgi:hypothetical protein